MADHETVHSGVLDTLRERMNWDTIVDTVKTNKHHLTEIAVWAALGFLVGFFFRRYSSYLAALIFVIFALWGLCYLDILQVTINWDRVHALVGMRLDDGAFVDNALEWLRANMAATISFVVGLFIGVKAA